MIAEAGSFNLNTAKKLRAMKMAVTLGFTQVPVAMNHCEGTGKSLAACSNTITDSVSARKRITLYKTKAGEVRRSGAVNAAQK